ncbi:MULTISPECIES: hypothetical protein [Brevundimonas]|uniref:hypothetical protein n=1 Tax=Brevundimonas sp. UBA7507 TaxID=1946137 RepID=UPI0025808869|nr:MULTISPECIES: hypothetical protein [Brevundimonas]
MSMTTPRVTVPVEPTEGMIEAAESAGMSMAGSDMSSPDMTRHVWSAMLSAAPATEGGAVDPLAGWTPHDGVWGEPPALAPETLLHVLRRNGNVAGPYRAGRIEWHHQNADSDPLFYRPAAAALAAREEPPAEAGEDDVRGLIGEAIQGLERAVASTRFDSASKEVFSACVDDFRKVLRVQPPAREDAQPVGYWVTHPVGENPVFIRYGSFVPADDRYTVQPLYTHPAPDALRGALEEARDAVDFFDRVKAATQAEQIAVGRDHWTRMEAALRRLAALQAEQKGGAA